ncbi:hypothetical protein C8E89_104131 [Mycolicibacterium moriokaense]|uniref:Uncharacterized protein n=1 Tax=Mycolicibacterium moriokaense TaxID=39691 RepID=A0A318HIT7_9MYCO|nr:hypothetical protein C8E89_104131 [Mycolicibacterium moriokaense]
MYDLEQASTIAGRPACSSRQAGAPRAGRSGPRTGDPGAVATSKPPVVPELFAHLRRDLGAEVYGSMGITRDNTEGRRIAVLHDA